MSNNEMCFQLSKKDFKRFYEMNQILKNIYSQYIINNGVVTGKPVECKEDNFDVSHFYSGTINQYWPEYLSNKIVMFDSNDIYTYYRDNKTPATLYCKKNHLYLTNGDLEGKLIGKVLDENEFHKFLHWNKSIVMALRAKTIQKPTTIDEETINEILEYEKVVVDFGGGLSCQLSLSLFPTLKKFKNLSAYVFAVDVQPKTFLVLFESMAENGDMFSIIYRFTK